MPFLIELEVSIDCMFPHAREKLAVLRRFICDAVQLQSLTIYAHSRSVRLLGPLVETVEACVTIQRIEVDSHGHRGDYDDDVMVVQLRRFAARNEQLARFMASPNTYPNVQLLDLMRQFNNCPTGRYRLARCLPGMFTIQSGHSLFQ